MAFPDSHCRAWIFGQGAHCFSTVGSASDESPAGEEVPSSRSDSGRRIPGPTLRRLVIVWWLGLIWQYSWCRLYGGAIGKPLAASSVLSFRQTAFPGSSRPRMVVKTVQLAAFMLYRSNTARGRRYVHTKLSTSSCHQQAPQASCHSALPRSVEGFFFSNGSLPAVALLCRLCCSVVNNFVDQTTSLCPSSRTLSSCGVSGGFFHKRPHAHSPPGSLVRAHVTSSPSVWRRELSSMLSDSPGNASPQVLPVRSTLVYRTRSLN